MPSISQDTRAAAMQIGAVILFGFLITAMALYQAAVVPMQNGDIEYNHAQRVQEDMLEVRNQLLETRQNGERGYATVSLGTTYPARVWALNPAPAAGTLETTEAKPIVVTNGAGSDVSAKVCPGDDPQTKFFRYVPKYHYYSEAPTLYVENTIMHQSHPEGQTIVESPQALVEDHTVNIASVTGNYSKSRSTSVVIQPEPGGLLSNDVTDPTVTLPTKLSETKWEEILVGEVDPANITVSNGNLTLSLSGEYTVKCGPTGVNSVPPSGGPTTGAENEINPAAPGDIQLTAERQTGNKGEIEIRFTNQANDSLNVTEARINYYYDDTEQGNQKQNPASLDIYNSNGSHSANLVIREDFVKLDPEIELVNGTNDVRFVVLDGDGNAVNLDNRDYFVMTLEFESGESGTYFIPIPKDNTFSLSPTDARQRVGTSDLRATLVGRHYGLSLVGQTLIIGGLTAVAVRRNPFVERDLS